MFSCHINLVISNHVIYNIKYKCLEYKNFQSVKHKVSNKLGNYSHYNIFNYAQRYTFREYIATFMA